ncbi:MAG TPA: asparagine synthase (glutamine-hydrolyzing) [Bryobacteraceae bacterium]|nr:asparagine synthase (glutamine-hydrolyzing) [Bryobacteraceae bacterium]
MCGIAGVAGENYGHHRGRELVRGMIEVQRHRGPDSEGTFADSHCTLGHRRLAILDLTVAGAQPMTSTDGRWTIVFNGEIFNYLELREQLGGEFRSGSDTEVLLRACAEWGVEKALERSVGMYAFGLWDARERALTLARDRVGEKPLVYFHRPGMIAFASELKALDPFHERRLDPMAMDAYLALGYVPAPLAIFRHCRKLEPGHLVFYKNGQAELRRWWRPENARREAPRRSREELIEDLRARVADAVRLRLRSDVPVAIFLSGGVDSSIIAAECVRQGSKLEAFTADFGDGHPDLEHATLVARHLGLQQEVLPVDARRSAQDFEKLLWYYDEPFADSSAIPAFALAHELRGRYRVVLNGEGGDETFGGYRHYERITAKQAIKAAAAAMGFADGATSVYVESKAAFRQEERNCLLNGNGGGNSLSWLLKREGYRVPKGSALKKAMWSDRHLYLPNDLTYKIDIALAASGVEGRAPFLDHRLLEWAQSLPERELVAGREKKVLLRDAYRDQLPARVLGRVKQGFGAPIERWLAGPLRELALEATPCPLLEADRQRNLKGQKLWMMVALAQWARRWSATW